MPFPRAMSVPLPVPGPAAPLPQAVSSATGAASAGATRRLDAIVDVFFRQGGQLGTRIQRRQFLEAADRPAVDENLRHGAAARAAHEIGACLGVAAHVDLVGGDAAHLRDELGDLLLQIGFQSQLAAETGRFTVAEVARAIADKLVRRHPHVFGDVEVRDAGEVVRNWRRIKAEERRTAGEDGDLFAGVPAASPALVRAEQLGEKAGHVGLDWPDAHGVLEKLREETAELEAALAAGDRAASERELGDLLLAAASLGRHLEVSAEMALRAANDRFVARVRRLEAAARERGQALADLAPAERDRLWAAVKCV